ncbi:MAG: di-heme enzyme [Polyangiaceae bacterium]|nr:di-heme enzyme [Polyangiaceae bacterium]
MRARVSNAALALGLAALSGCGAGGDDAPAPVEAYRWPLGYGLPEPRVPEDNPMSEAKVELGRHLFYDPRLSGNQTQSCASCHKQELAFTDGRATSEGSTGERTRRSSMSLANVAYAASFTWANPTLLGLEEQALTPLLGERPVELGLRGREDEMLERLRAEPRYAPLFAAAFPGPGDPFTLGHVTRALSSFERRILSGSSPYDRFQYGRENDAISDAAKRGARLFGSEKLECFHCHAGFNFQDGVTYVGKPPNFAFQNNGLYNVDGKGGYPATDTGLYEFTGKPADMGRFRVPTLRNVAVTAPYMHDGSIATLSEVLDHYAAAGRTLPDGPNAGVGSANPYKSPFLVGFELSEGERADVLAFFDSLTDHELLTDPALADPW